MSILYLINLRKFKLTLELECFRIIPHVRYFAASATTVLNRLNSLEFHNDYDEIQTAKILNVVNKQSPEELTLFNISKQRIMKIDSWKKQQGEFKSVSEILELDGFGLKVLEKFCESILATNSESKTIAKKTVANKTGSRIVAPPLNNEFRWSITSFISFHVDVNHIAWAKCTIGGGKVSVGDFAFYALGEDDKKPSLSDLIQVLVLLHGKIPEADVYVFEMQQTSRPATQPGKPTQIIVDVQRSQVLAMLSVLMAVRDETVTKKEMDLPVDANEAAHQKVFFLKNYVSSRLFKTYIGNERVSTDHVIQHIFRCNEGVDRPNNITFTDIDIPLNLRQQFDGIPKVEREFIGQATLNGLAFYKLALLKCHESSLILNKRGFGSKTE